MFVRTTWMRYKQQSALAMTKRYKNMRMRYVTETQTSYCQKHVMNEIGLKLWHTQMISFHIAQIVRFILIGWQPLVINRLLVLLLFFCCLVLFTFLIRCLLSEPVPLHSVANLTVKHLRFVFKKFAFKWNWFDTDRYVVYCFALMQVKTFVTTFLPCKGHAWCRQMHIRHLSQSTSSSVPNLPNNPKYRNGHSQQWKWFNKYFRIRK